MQILTNMRLINSTYILRSTEKELYHPDLSAQSKFVRHGRLDDRINTEISLKRKSDYSKLNLEPIPSAFVLE